MREVHYYIFEDELECENYEDKCELEELGSDIVCLAENMKTINPMDGAEMVYYIKLGSEAAVEWWSKYNRSLGYSSTGCTEPGQYYYDDCSSEWKSLEEALSTLEAIKTKLEGKA